MLAIELEQGMRGFQVRTAQSLLNEELRLRPPLELDGEFGPLTERMVRRFQERQCIEADGIVGRKTWGKLGVQNRPIPRATKPQVAPPPIVRPKSPIIIPSAPVRPRPRQIVRSGSGDPVVQNLEMMARAAPEAHWMKFALAEYGVSEIRGRGHNRRIIEYHAATTLKAQTDEVPWCASFVNWVLKQDGLRGSESAAAASFSDWGVATQPRFGCIVHIFRAPRGGDRATGSSSGNHVAFLISKSDTHIRLLGGNQGDTVKPSTFSLAKYKVRSFRWPAK